MYPIPERRNACLWQWGFSLARKKWRENSEKDHEGPQTDLPKDFVWPSCKVTSYVLRLALQTVKFQK